MVKSITYQKFFLKINGHQQRWSRPLPGAILIPPATLVVVDSVRGNRESFLFDLYTGIIRAQTGAKDQIRPLGRSFFLQWDSGRLPDGPAPPFLKAVPRIDIGLERMGSGDEIHSPGAGSSGWEFLL